MKFLDEVAALEEIRNLLSEATTAQIAVAFWGRGAISRLGLDRDGLSAKILCNLESGACNPAEIRLLRDLPQIQLRSHAALHAKVYWTPAGAVVGSSNASANGLAVEGDSAKSWMEANVRLDDPSVSEELEHWFGELFGAGHEISDADIDRAEQLWKARAKLTPSGTPYAGNLLAAFANAPDHAIWRQVKLAFWKDWLTDADQAWLEAEYEAGRLSRDIDVYSEWSASILPGEWVLDFNLSGDELKFSIWRALPAQFRRPDLRFVRKMKHLSFAAFGRLQITDQDVASLASIAAAALKLRGDKERRNAVIDLPTAIELLGSVQTMPSEKAFLKAMERIYADAAEIDYYPREFRRMLAELGGVQTARQLVRGRATYGFTKLWEKGRLDLSVEAVMLKPEWRPLFTAEELNIAERRLREYDYVSPD